MTAGLVVGGTAVSAASTGSTPTANVIVKQLQFTDSNDLAQQLGGLDLNELLGQLPSGEGGLDLSGVLGQLPTNGGGLDLNELLGQLPTTGGNGYGGSGTVEETQDEVDTPAVPSTPAQPSQPAVQQPATDNDAADTAQSDSGFEAEVVRLVNAQRAQAGLTALTSNAELAEVAMAKAKDMDANNYFDHTSPTYGSPFDMMRQFGISFNYAGENIASGQQSPQQVMNDWMNSTGHRQNIMSANFTQIGVAYYNGEWVQMFIG
ncbi:serine protease [Paenibacillus sp. IB182496]|uniref:Serine protease n=2 Tax=Paenibacillus sabuli TaxID=2772509 RepID=A0A927BUD0_9BACL|nr:serine protease [Paenibacillus sabuli]